MSHVSYEVNDELIEQIWCDLGRQVERSRVAKVANDVAAGFREGAIPTYVPLFVRRLSRERLSAELAAAAAGPPLPAASRAPEGL